MPLLMIKSPLKPLRMLSRHGLLLLLLTSKTLSSLSPSSRPMTLISTLKLAMLSQSGLPLVPFLTSTETSKLLSSSWLALPTSPLPPASLSPPSSSEFDLILISIKDILTPFSQFVFPYLFGSTKGAILSKLVNSAQTISYFINSR
jgi:hypothetical protein